MTDSSRWVAKKIFIFAWAILLLIALYGKPTAGANRDDFFLEPYLYKADFERGSVGSWSSYPPFQDTAYDYTIMVEKIQGHDSNALAREIVPNYPIEYRFGVRKKLDLFVDAKSTLSFKFYIKSYSGTEGVLVKFGFEDGASYEAMISSKEILKWQKADIRLETVIGGARLKRLKAIAFMAICPNVDPESLLRLAIDDVTINGYRGMPFIVNTPGSCRLEEFQAQVLKKHFCAGKGITIEGEFPGDANITGAYAELSGALTGENRQTFQMQKLEGAGWRLKIPPSQAKEDMWRADIQGVGDDGKVIASTVYFIVTPANTPVGHPRLLISKEDQKGLQEAIKSEPYQTIWNNIKSKADSLRTTYDPGDFNYHLEAYDDLYWLPTLSGYNTTISTPGKLARGNGLVYFLTGSAEAGEAVANTLLKMADWPTYVHPHIFRLGQYTYFPVGMAVGDLSLGYDTVYNLLEPGDRKKIAAALFQNGIVNVFDEYVRDNRVSSDTSNWIAHVTGGGIMAAAAIQDEYTSAELEPYLTGLILKLGELLRYGFDNSGNYGEGYSYHGYTLQTLAETMAVLERNFGIRFPGKVLHSFRYIFYQADVDTGKIYDFGDSRNQLGTMTNFVYLLNKTRDPVLKWFYDKNPGYEDMDLFYYDKRIAAKGPFDLPKTAWFKDVGTVIFRSGFTHRDFVFIFRCGPFYNHQHFDHGSFFLLDKGEELVMEPGRTDYYNDPWYNKLFIQPGGHNCILVNENIESQRTGGDLLGDVRAWQDHGKIKDFSEFQDGAFVSADLTGLYKGKFRELTRNILYLQPRTVIIIDKGVGAKDTQRMNVRFHSLKKDDLNVAGKTVEIARPGATLYIRTVFPARYSAEIVKRPLTLDEFNEAQGEMLFALPEMGFVQLTADVDPVCTTLINVLTTDKEVIYGLNATSSDLGNFSSLTVGGTTYYINCSANEAMTVGGVKTGALVYAAAKEKDKTLELGVKKSKESPGARNVCKEGRGAVFINN